MKITIAVGMFFPIAIVLIAQGSFIQKPSPKKARCMKKIALVIGVDKYKYMDSLKTYINDAIDMSHALSRLGFQVLVLKDPQKSDLKRVMDSLIMMTKETSTCLVYFSGHSMSFNGKDYLLMREANPVSSKELHKQTYPVEDILRSMQSARIPTNIIFLDICRQSPPQKILKSRFIRRTERTDSYPLGQFFIGYATYPGGLAFSNVNRNSLFTASLLKYIDNPQLSLDQIFYQVNKEVRIATADRQIPCMNNTLEKEFYFSASDNCLPTIKGSCPDNSVHDNLCMTNIH